MKQHIKGKPIHFGYKSWCWNLKSGYLIDFEIYQGAKGQQNKSKKIFGYGNGITLQFAERLPKTNNIIIPHCLYADNYFTSLSLIDCLATNEIGCVETIRSNRIEKCSLDDIKHSQRGHYVISYDTTNQVLLCRWNDNSVVTLTTNYQGVTPINQSTRYSFASSKTIIVTQPNFIKNYNENMGGTDRMDQNVAYYRTSLRSKKWYWPLFIWELDVSVQNAWLLYRKMRENVANQPEIDLLEFQRDVAKALLTSYGKIPSRPGNVHSMQKRVGSDTRYDNTGHLICSQDKRTHCVLCHSTTNKKCIKCNIALHEEYF
ncbi:transposase is4 [Holotrichia oblita]|uniref:Transposase is4 n=1 Tax=Holotrichia oblita TaxID=644536 RepID=A0ACB9TUS1_HOLOL|nr:transposase is4 [Holotrichia oblita]